MAGASTPLGAADRLCRACVDLLDIDGAAVSVLHDGSSRGTFGSSDDLSRRLDEVHFAVGEGPCIDAVRSGVPVFAPDLQDPCDERWPAFKDAVLPLGIDAVFALPVILARVNIGALDLYRHDRGRLNPAALAGGLLAAELAALPLLDLMVVGAGWHTTEPGRGQPDPDLDVRSGSGWDDLASLQRVEVYQATGMVMEALGVDAAEALVRLRAHAFAEGVSTNEIAWGVVERRVVLDRDVPTGPRWPA